MEGCGLLGTGGIGEGLGAPQGFIEVDVVGRIVDGDLDDVAF